MSHPMNEFVTDFETPESSTDKWIATSSITVGSVCHKAGHVMYSGMTRGRNYYQSARKRIGSEAQHISEVMREHPRLSALVGIGAGTMIGYLISSRIHGDSN